MPIRLKPIDRLAAKYGRNAQAAAPAYTEGLQFAKRDQAEAAVASAGLYIAAVTASGADGFAKGVRAAGTEKWLRKASGVGAQRYGPGVQAAVPDWQAGFGPFAEAIGAVTLPARQVKGQNAARNQAVVDALIKRKQGLA